MRFLFWGDGNVLESVVMVVQPSEYTKTTEFVHFEMVKIIDFMLYKF